MNNPKFVLFKDIKAEFRFRLNAKNGEPILAGSEGYSSKQACKDGIQSVKNNCIYDSRYDRRIATNGQYYFILKASNGQTLGISEYYKTSRERDEGIEAVKRDAPDAPTEDKTL
jgi:uncharacterized protein